METSTLSLYTGKVPSRYSMCAFLNTCCFRWCNMNGVNPVVVLSTEVHPWCLREATDVSGQHPCDGVASREFWVALSDELHQAIHFRLKDLSEANGEVFICFPMALIVGKSRLFVECVFPSYLGLHGFVFFACHSIMRCCARVNGWVCATPSVLIHT